MALNPTQWSVVAVARWNRAILTPAGIRKRLFKRPEEGPVEVLVPIDLLAPPQVKLDNMTVIADWDRLTVAPDRCTFEQLDTAREISINALESLPETPVGAVGYNVMYRSDSPIDELRSLLESPADDRFSDLGFEFTGRRIARVISWMDGTINFSVEEDADQNKYTIRFNFDRKSVDADHNLTWLRVSINDVQSQVQKIITKVLGIPEEEINDDRRKRTD